MKNPLKVEYNTVDNTTVFSYKVWRYVAVSNPDFKPLTDRQMKDMKKEVKAILIKGIKKDLNIHD